MQYLCLHYLSLRYLNNTQSNVVSLEIQLVTLKRAGVSRLSQQVVKGKASIY